jgi:hypothetical protein
MYILEPGFASVAATERCFSIRGRYALRKETVEERGHINSVSLRNKEAQNLNDACEQWKDATDNQIDGGARGTLTMYGPERGSWTMRLSTMPLSTHGHV